MSDSPHVHSVTDTSFETDVLERSHDIPVVVDFWAPWCGPCKQLGPVLEQLADESDGDWELAKVNVDDNQQTARSFNVRGIPAVKAVVDGEVVDEFTGAKPRSSVQRWLQGFLPSESDRTLEQARASLDAGDLDAAESKFREVLEEKRYDTEALVGLARVALTRGNADRAAEHLDEVPDGMEEEAGGRFESTWLKAEAARAGDPMELRERVEVDGDDLEARYEWAVQLAAEGDFGTALEQLLEIVRRDREFRDDLGRRAMIRTFEVMGPDSDEVREWRKKMGRAMY